jgi:acyl dehydratase
MTAPQVGDELPPRTIDSVSAERIKTMAVILDDPNPIHLDPAAAKALGLGDRVINQGPTGVGYLLDMLAAAFPCATMRKVELRFLANVLANDKVVAAGTIASVVDHEVLCDVWLDVEDGARAISGRATLVLPETRGKEK